MLVYGKNYKVRFLAMWLWWNSCLAAIVLFLLQYREFKVRIIMSIGILAATLLGFKFIFCFLFYTKALIIRIKATNHLKD